MFHIQKWKNPDRRNVHIGICMDQRQVSQQFCSNVFKTFCQLQHFQEIFYCRETVQCFDDLDCKGDLRCVVGYCGDQAYHDALVAMPCEEDYLCEDLHLGPECCLDVGGGVEHILAGDLEAQWGKKCCDNIRAPVTVPAANISLTDDTIAKVRELKLDNMNKILFFQLDKQVKFIQ